MAKKEITAYCIARKGNLIVDYLRKIKSESILALRLDDSDRMSWQDRQKEGFSCIKVIIKIK
jgi:hypothetical protein